MSTAPVGKKLAKPPPAYDWRDQHDTRSAIEDELARCVKRNEELQPARLVMADTVTGVRYIITVASGALTLTAIP